ncbi:MAG: DUF4054 domain-containing protein [Deltaproteobacteria bacterium]|nr:DUF4054 domain-containing protein [Deltaproteobacteria bacterium]
MAPTPSDFKTRFPEFDSVANSTVQLFLDDAALSVNTCIFGAKADLATMYLAAHLLSSSGASGTSGGSAGQITEETVGDLTRKYGTASVNVSSDGMNSTKYGQTFVRLRTESMPAPILVQPTGLTKIC